MSLPEVLRYQANACTTLGSPFMGRLLTLLADHWPEGSALARVCDHWEGDVGPNGASLPLRIAGGLHALVLTGRDKRLATVYPPNDAADTALIGAVLAAIDDHADFLLDWITNAPQTNEVRRSAALIPAAHLLAARHPLPFVSSELGASGGLNLMWDRYAVDAGSSVLGPPDPLLTLKPDWSGPVPQPANIQVAQRAGVDLNPIDPRDPDQALRLFAYLWADQPHRMDLTRAATAGAEVKVDKGDAIDWLADRLNKQGEGRLHLIYHTIAWQYFPAEKQAEGKAMIEAAGACATETRPLAWLRMENDGDSAGAGGAGLTLRLWPGDLCVTLARVDFHGRWVRWQVADL